MNLKKYDKPSVDIVKFQSSADIADSVKTISNVATTLQLGNIKITNVMDY